MFSIIERAQEESMGKYKGKVQRLCPVAEDQKLQGCLDSHRLLVCCLVLHPLFLVTCHLSMLHVNGNKIIIFDFEKRIIDGDTIIQKI
jgi:hypothetical protein